MVFPNASRLDLNFVRAQFPGLCRGWTLFDNAGGSQILERVVARIGDFYLSNNVQLGGSYDLSRDAANAVCEGREAASILVNAERPEEIVFGSSTTVLLQNLARSMRGQFSAGDEVIVTVSDHEANIGPWEGLQDMGVVVKFWPLSSEPGGLSIDDLATLMTSRTRLLCVNHVSNILGSINPIEEIAAFAHRNGARICVDGVAYAPHRAIDVRRWDVDYYVFSLYKAFGPHHAVMYAKYEHLFELDSLNHFFYGRDRIPAKLEPGNPNYELSYAVTGIVDYLRELGERAGCAGGPRDNLERAFEAIAYQEHVLTERFLAYLRQRPECRVIGSGEATGTRVSTVSFVADGFDSEMICKAMDRFGIAIRFGDFHARRLGAALGLAASNGAVRVSMVHYNTLEEVDRLTAALDDILDRKPAIRP